MKTLQPQEINAVSGGAFQHSDGNWYEMIEVAPGRFQMVPATPPLANNPPPTSSARPPYEFEAMAP